MKMHEETARQLEETRAHMANYMHHEDSVEELHAMCSHCEAFCGNEHDYAECEDRLCFKFWLAFQYLEWMNSWE